MGRPVHNLDIKNGGEAAKPLRANAEGIDLVENLDAEFLDLVLRAALFQLRHIDRAHQTFLCEQNSLFCGAANANAQHPGWAPASAHLRHHFQHPVDDGSAGVQHLELRLVDRKSTRLNTSHKCSTRLPYSA